MSADPSDDPSDQVRDRVRDPISEPVDRARAIEASGRSDRFDAEDFRRVDGRVRPSQAAVARERREQFESTVDRLDDQTAIDLGTDDVTREGDSLRLTDAARRREAAQALDSQVEGIDVSPSDIQFTPEGPQLTAAARRRAAATSLQDETATQIGAGDVELTESGARLTTAARRQEALASFQNQTDTQIDADDLSQTDDGFELAESARRREAAVDIDAEVGAIDVTASDVARTDDGGFALSDEARLEAVAADTEGVSASDLTIDGGEVQVRESVRQQAQTTRGALLRSDAVEQLQSQTTINIGTGDLRETDDGFTLTDSARRREAAASLQSETDTQIGIDDLTQTDDGAFALSVGARRREAAADIDEQIGAVDIGADDLTRDGTQFELSRGARQEIAAARASQDFGVAVDPSDITFQPPSTLGPEQIASQVSDLTGQNVQGEDIISADGSAVTFETDSGRQRIEIPLASDVNVSRSVRDTAATVDAIEEITGESVDASQVDPQDSVAETATQLALQGELSNEAARDVAQTVRADVAADLEAQDGVDIDLSGEDVQLSDDGFTLTESAARRNATVSEIEEITGESVTAGQVDPQDTVASTATQLALQGELSNQAAREVAQSVRADVAADFESQDGVNIDLTGEDVRLGDAGFRLTGSAATANALVGRVEELSGEEIQTGADVSGDLPSVIGELAIEGDLSRAGATQAESTLRRFRAFQLDTQREFETEISAGDVTLGQDGFGLTSQARREEAAADFASRESTDTEISAGDVELTDDGATLTDQARREEVAADFEAGLATDVSAADVTLTDDGAQLSTEALREEALARTEGFDTGTVAGVTSERLVVTDTPGEVDEDQFERVVSQGGRTVFVDTTFGDPQGSAPLLGERRGEDVSERQRIAAIAEVANQTDGVTGADLTFEGGEVQMTDEARQEQAREQAAAAFERQLSASEGINPRAAFGGGSAAALATTGPVRSGGFDVDFDASDVTSSSVVFDADTEVTPTPTEVAELDAGQRMGREALAGTQFSLTASGRDELAEAVQERTENLRELPLLTQPEATGVEEPDAATPGAQARAGYAEAAQEIAAAGGVGTGLSADEVAAFERGQAAEMIAASGGTPTVASGIRSQQARLDRQQAIARAGLRSEAARRFSETLGFDVTRRAVNLERETRDGQTILSPELDAEVAREMGRRQGDVFSGVVDAIENPSESPAEAAALSLTGVGALAILGSQATGSDVPGEGSVRNRRSVDQVTGDTPITDQLTRGGVLSERPGSGEGLLPGRVAGVNISKQGFRSAASSLREFGREEFDESPGIGRDRRVTDPLTGRELTQAERIASGAPFAGGASLGERALQGVATVGVEAGAAAVQSPALADTGVEVATNLPGTVQREGVGDVAMAGAGVATVAGSQIVRDFQESPIERGAGTLTGAAIGVGFSRILDRAATAFRSGRIEALADSRAELEETSSGSAAADESITDFETPPDAPTEEAVDELEEIAADNPDELAPGSLESVLFHTTDADISGVRGLRNRLDPRRESEFSVGEGASELPGLFTAGVPSPIGLAIDADSSFSVSDVLSPRLPGRTKSDQIIALPGDDIRGMPDWAQGAGYELRRPDGEVVERDLSRGGAKDRAEGTDLEVRPQSDTGGYEFLMDEAETGVAYVRPTGSRTPEQEGIIAPESEFVQEGLTAVEMPSGRVIPARRFQRRGAGELDATTDAGRQVSAPGVRAGIPDVSLPSRAALTPDADTIAPTGTVRPGISFERDADAGFIEVGEEVRGTLRSPVTEVETRAFEAGRAVSQGVDDLQRGVRSVQVRTETAAFRAGRFADEVEQTVRETPDVVAEELRRLQQGARLRGLQVRRAAANAPERAIRGGEVAAFRAGVAADRALTEGRRGLRTTQVRAETAAFRAGQTASDVLDEARNAPDEVRDAFRAGARRSRRASQVPLERAQARAFGFGRSTDQALTDVERALRNTRARSEAAAFRAGQTADDVLDELRTTPRRVQRGFETAGGRARRLSEVPLERAEARAFGLGRSTDRALTDLERGLRGTQARADTAAFRTGQRVSDATQAARELPEQLRQDIGSLQQGVRVRGRLTAEALADAPGRAIREGEAAAFRAGVSTDRALTDLERGLRSTQTRAETAAFRAGQSTSEILDELRATPGRARGGAETVGERARRLSEIPMERAEARAFELGVGADRTLTDLQRGARGLQVGAETAAFRAGQTADDLAASFRAAPGEVADRAGGAAETARRLSERPLDRAATDAFALGVRTDRSLTDVRRSVFGAQARAETAAFQAGQTADEVLDELRAAPARARTGAETAADRARRLSEIPMERAEAQAFEFGVETDRATTAARRGVRDLQVRAETRAFRAGQQTGDALDRLGEVPDDLRQFADEATIRIEAPQPSLDDVSDIADEIPVSGEFIPASQLPVTRISRRSPDEVAGPGGVVGGTVTAASADVSRGRIDAAFAVASDSGPESTGSTATTESAFVDTSSGFESEFEASALTNPQPSPTATSGSSASAASSAGSSGVPDSFTSSAAGDSTQPTSDTGYRFESEDLSFTSSQDPTQTQPSSGGRSDGPTVVGSSESGFGRSDEGLTTQTELSSPSPSEGSITDSLSFVSSPGQSDTPSGFGTSESPGISESSFESPFGSSSSPYASPSGSPSASPSGGPTSGPSGSPSGSPSPGPTTGIPTGGIPGFPVDSQPVPGPRGGFGNAEMEEQGELLVAQNADLLSSRIASGEELIDMSLGDNQLANEATSPEDLGFDDSYLR